MEQHQHGIQLQSTRQHIKNQHQLGPGRKKAEIARRTDFLQTGTYVAQARNCRCEGRYNIVIFKGKQ